MLFRSLFFGLSLCLCGCGLQSSAERCVLIEEPQPVCVKLLFTGDVMQHLPQIEAARRGDGFDYDEMLAAMRPRFEAADLTVVNLETTLTRSSRYAGYPFFRSPIALAEALARAGVDVATLANNHCCDGGGPGVRTTVEELTRCGTAIRAFSPTVSTARPTIRCMRSAGA